MAKTQNWGFTNVTTKDINVNPVNIGIVSNYAEIKHEADTVVFDNVTAPLDQGEKISYYYRDLAQVSSDNAVANPGKIQKGFQFIVKVDSVSRTTLDNGDVIDDPVVMMLTVRGSKDGNVTPAMLDTMLTRLLGACYNFTDSKFRFGELMRSALEPQED